MWTESWAILRENIGVINMGLRSILGKVAPFLGGLVGGPLGTIATGVIGKILLPSNSNPSEDELELALASASPDQLTEIRRIDAEYKVNMAEINYKNNSLEQRDRASARRRQVNTKDKMPAVLSVLFLGSFIALAVGAALGYVKISPLVETLTETIDVTVLLIASFYFGGRVSRKEKND